MRNGPVGGGSPRYIPDPPRLPRPRRRVQSPPKAEDVECSSDDQAMSAKRIKTEVIEISHPEADQAVVLMPEDNSAALCVAPENNSSELNMTYDDGLVSNYADIQMQTYIVAYFPVPILPIDSQNYVAFGNELVNYNPEILMSENAALSGDACLLQLPVADYGSANVKVEAIENCDSVGLNASVGQVVEHLEEVSEDVIVDNTPEESDKDSEEFVGDVTDVASYCARLKQLKFFRAKQKLKDPKTSVSNIPVYVKRYLTVLQRDSDDTKEITNLKEMELAYKEFMEGCSREENSTQTRNEREKNRIQTQDKRKELEELMRKTKLLRYEELYNIKEISLVHLCTIYPGLRVLECIKQEYSSSYRRYENRCGVAQFEKELVVYFEQLMDEAVHKPSTERSTWEEKAVKAYQNGKNGRYDKKVAGAVLHAANATKGKCLTQTIRRFSAKTKIPKALLTPFGRVSTSESDWGMDTKFTIFVERSELTVVENFFNALLVIYLYYWIFYLKYTPNDEVLFEKFDELATCKYARKRTARHT